MHDVTDAQETADRLSGLPSVEFGVDWIVQAVPFHLIANVTDPIVLVNAAPTAVHAVGNVQETPSRSLEIAAGGIGVPTLLQARPFQCSAQVCWPWAAVWKVPTAAHDVDDAHETPDSALEVTPVGLKLG